MGYETKEETVEHENIPGGCIRTIRVNNTHTYTTISNPNEATEDTWAVVISQVFLPGVHWHNGQFVMLTLEEMFPGLRPAQPAPAQPLRKAPRQPRSAKPKHPSRSSRTD